jgi:Kef-type K+ transport system membrane component KefB
MPVTWPWVMLYATLIVAASEAIYAGSKVLDPTMPIHLEVLLPAFALGCILMTPPGQNPHVDDATEGVEEGPETPTEQRVSTIVSACFMVLVGLSMPAIELPAGVGWGTIGIHVVAITLLSNLGKMFPLLCYRREADWRQRLALSIGMWPRGEVGAGVLVIAMSYNMRNLALTVAVLSLSLNLLCTGLFILMVKRLLGRAVRVGDDDVVVVAAANEAAPIEVVGEEVTRVE